MFVYTMSGFLASISGIILLSRLVSAQPTAGLGQELPVIAASIIGGTSLVGGEGTAFGAVLGAAIIGVLENGIVLLGINTYAQQVVTGSGHAAGRRARHLAEAARAARRVSEIGPSRDGAGAQLGRAWVSLARRSDDARGGAHR